MKEIELPELVQLNYPSNFNYRQGANECGPYVAGAVARILLKADVRPKDMVDKLSWKLPGGYTHPWALEKLLKSINISSISYSAGKLGSQDKQRFLIQELANGSPIILLVKMHGYQHYIVLLGFDENTNEFFIYDPVYTRGEEGYTIDENGDHPGNRTISWDALNDRWDEGGVFGFFDWYALVAGKE
jgi:hypothetical protein